MVVALVAGCSDGTFDKLPRPEGEAASTTSTTALAELSKVVLPGVPGETTTTIDAGPGRAALAGTVTGPDGPVAGATVRVERLVGDGAARTDVVTAADGTWTLPRIKGGRYRVRAFRAPDMAQTRSEVFLLEGDEERRLDLRVEAFGAVSVTRAIAPNPPPVDEPANLVVRVVRRTVDPDGVVRAEPLVGLTVELFGTGRWSLGSTNPTTTDGGGNASFRLTCLVDGDNPLSVLVDGTETTPLDLPACASAPPSTTTTIGEDPGEDPGEESTTTTGDTTTTLDPTTTSTAEPSPPDDE
jgi:hypothetical protein